ncbi:MAG TPA: ABC transporter ATP-binding protein [Stellaceae bacterium]|jgi:branched-chain amino acid transport system ATP-binding protein|nr:ABC transporter ATP-binding protein [Stellaceae bacterium]
MLEVTGLNVWYGATEVLRDVGFSVPDGRIVALLGGNGSGKTTILNSLTGMVRPRAGSILLEGEECIGQRPDQLVRRGMAQVPQGREVFASMSVIDNLEMGAVTRRDRRAVADDIDEVLTFFPALRQKGRARAGGLSGGEQQMVAIGRAMLSRPKCLLMDEPSAGLSPVMVNVLVDTILGLHERGLTILLVEQNVGVAAALADSAHVLQHGEIVFSGPAAGLLDSPEILQSYLGR